MTGRRKGTPCACNTNPCSYGSSRNCVRAVNNVSPDPNGDLVIRGGMGIEIIQSGDDLVINNTANPNAFIAGNNIELNPSGDDISIDLVDEPVVDGLTVNGDTQLNGDLEVNGDIIQNGAAYETHAEHIYSRDDFIIMRDGAIAALAPGDYAGFKVKLYDGVNDGALVIDNSGTARVGDVGDEQPLLTRDESADLTDGDLLQWDAAGMKAVGSGIAASDLVQGSGNIGSDTKPVKIVNGTAEAVTDDLLKADAGVFGASSGYVQIGDNVYIVFGEFTAPYTNSQTTNTNVTLPFTVANTNYQPIVSLKAGAGYWGDIAWAIGYTDTTYFTISTRCQTSASVSDTATFRWMAIVKKA